MAIEACTVLGLIDRDLSGKLVEVVEEHGSNISFLIGSLMWNAANSNASVCLLALHKTSNHYQNVGKKLGLTNKNITFLEPFNMYDGTTQILSNNNVPDKEIIKSLFADVKKSLESIPGKKYLIIDDLSDLMSLGSSLALTVTFLQHCRALQASDPDMSVVVCTHSSEDNKEQQLLANYIAHIADYKVQVAGLKTGFSANVTGMLDVVDKLGDASSFSNRLFHFKLTDRLIKVFAPGAVQIH